MQILLYIILYIHIYTHTHTQLTKNETFWIQVMNEDILLKTIHSLRSSVRRKKRWSLMCKEMKTQTQVCIPQNTFTV